jgi:hypothetical protein
MAWYIEADFRNKAINRGAQLLSQFQQYHAICDRTQISR